MALERGEGSASCPGRSLPLGKDPVPTVQEAGWAPGPVWTGVENLAHTGIWFPDRLARCQLLYQLHYQAHKHAEAAKEIYILKTCIHVQYFPFRICAKYCKLDTLTRYRVCISRIPVGCFFPHQQFTNFGEWFFEHTEVSADSCVLSVKLCTAAL